MDGHGALSLLCMMMMMMMISIVLLSSRLGVKGQLGLSSCCLYLCAVTMSLQEGDLGQGEGGEVAGLGAVLGSIPVGQELFQSLPPWRSPNNASVIWLSRALISFNPCCNFCRIPWENLPRLRVTALKLVGNGSEKVACRSICLNKSDLCFHRRVVRE